MCLCVNKVQFVHVVKGRMWLSLWYVEQFSIFLPKGRRCIRKFTIKRCLTLRCQLVSFQVSLWILVDWRRGSFLIWSSQPIRRINALLSLSMQPTSAGEEAISVIASACSCWREVRGSVSTRWQVLTGQSQLYRQDVYFRPVQLRLGKFAFTCVFTSFFVKPSAGFSVNFRLFI